ncbi:MAG TPA: GNAT family N-acetyltransferase [Dehalococcoidia bacterium]
MTSAPRVVVAAPGTDVNRLVAPIVTAFSSDPFVRWLLPDAARFLAHFAALARSNAAIAVGCGAARHTDDFRAAAVWLPAAVETSLEARKAFVQGIPEGRRESAFAVFDRMSAGHPTEPAWHLHLLGVDPPLQGAGYGSALLEATLRELDASHVAAFLESTSPGSRRLYERHGFQATDEIQLADSPPIWPMLRSAR